MKLVIVESPSKAKTISKYLGSEYQVYASGGHIRDLPEKTLGVDVQNEYKAIYIVPNNKEKQVKLLKSKVEKANSVLLATDPDREGEAISWHLQYLLGLKEDDNIRIEFHEITKNAVLKAVEKPRKINMDLVNAQQTRRILDRLVGYKLSPFLCTKVRKNLSAGRVQSVTLRMIVEKEREIRAFIPEEYWNINGIFNKENEKKTFKAAFNDINGKKTKVVNKAQADKIIENTKTADEIKVDSVDKKQQVSRPNAPFTTSTMQQDAVNKLSMSTRETMRCAQELYEGVDLQELGHVALITYMRTDSTRISDIAQKAAKEYILKNFGEKYAPAKFNNYTTKKNAQDAHEAIRPISLDITPDMVKDKVSRKLYRLYKLIYERFVASQMAPAIYDTVKVSIGAKKGSETYGYRLSGKAVNFDGYTAIYQMYEDDKKDEEKEKDEKLDLLPQFEKGEKIELKSITGEQKFTQPPYRYTEASLVKKLEESGIGRPSTYATILGVLSKRDYTVKEKKYIVPTPLGENVVDILTDHFPGVMDIKFTSKMESQLDDIAEGKAEWVEVLDSFYPSFEKQLKEAYKVSNTEYRPEPIQSDLKCFKCGSPMNIMEGRYGRFYGCSNYPNCKNIVAYGEVVAKCPKCGKPVIKRFAKKSRKVFYACVDNKGCGFMSWDLPADHLCPKCNSTLKQTKAEGGFKNQCTNKDCGYSEIELVEKNDVKQ